MHQIKVKYFLWFGVSAVIYTNIVMFHWVCVGGSLSWCSFHSAQKAQTVLCLHSVRRLEGSFAQRGHWGPSCLALIQSFLHCLSEVVRSSHFRICQSENRNPLQLRFFDLFLINKPFEQISLSGGSLRNRNAIGRNYILPKWMAKMSPILAVRRLKH